MFVSQLTGFRSFVTNLRSQNLRIQQGVERGLKRAGLLLLRYAQKIVPVEFGLLKASGFVRVEGYGMAARVNVGFTAAYAIYVHENLDAAHGAAYNTKYADDIKAGRKKARGPNQQAKFVERPAREHRPELLAVIRASIA